jgi:hypothetical protein
VIKLDCHSGFTILVFKEWVTIYKTSKVTGNSSPYEFNKHSLHIFVYMDRKYLLGAFIALIALTCVIFLSGCLKGPTYSYEYSLSDPYNVSGVVEMRVNATANILINNSRGGELKFKVDNASLTAVYEGGARETVDGFGAEGVVPADGTYKLALTFPNVPVKYALVDEPPRFHPLIKYYDINVTTTGQQMIIVVWSPTQTSTKDIRIPLKDMAIGDYLSKVKDSLTLNPDS